MRGRAIGLSALLEELAASGTQVKNVDVRQVIGEYPDFVELTPDDEDEDDEDYLPTDEEECEETSESEEMPAPLHNLPSDDTKLKGALHASINLYGKGKGNLEEEDMEQENVLAIDEFAARTGGKRKGFGPQSSLAHYLGQHPPGDVFILHNEFTPQGHFMTGH
ncbi:hypothetical protein L7F22_008160 [Adiantum nelumboides]|nr:hypothetical protein [Adiantum nelumboides]